MSASKNFKNPQMYRFGQFCVDPARRILTRGGQLVPVTGRAFDVLLALLDRAGHTVDKDDLLRSVWPTTIVEEANLSQQIFMLRKLLGHCDDEPYIATVPRRGYRFVAPVTGSVMADPPVAPPAGSRPHEMVHGTARFEIPIAGARIPAASSSAIVAVSRDGRLIAYVAADGATSRLYLRPLEHFAATAIAGTEGASHPFFWPDGRWIGFHAGRRLLKVAIDGGPPFVLADVADLRGATCTAAGDVVYAPGPATGLWRVPASGGTAVPATTLDFDAGERTHRWPHALADGRVIFTIGMADATSFDEARLAISSTDPRRHSVILHHATDARCTDGRLVWARGGSLFVAPFDATTGAVDPRPRVVQSGVAMSATGVAHFDCSDTGVLVHVPGGAETLQRSLVAVDRSGQQLTRLAGGHSLEEPRFSRDGGSIVLSLRGRTSDLWLFDIVRGALRRLTFGGENFAAIWGPDARSITFSASPGGTPTHPASDAANLFTLQPDRSEPPELLIASEFDKVAGGWSADGAMLVFTEYHPDSGADLWVLDRAAQRVQPLIRTRFNEYAPALSPDGRCLAYVTDESGRAEVVAVSFPDASAKRQLSTDGGTEPLWSPDGSELFYRSGHRLMRIDISSGIAHAGIPTTLFEGPYVAGTVTLANYDVSPDATQFVMVVAEAPVAPSALRVTLSAR
jgi:eukaryotic-like serine/threonine-protein kinase